ncbi:hypothetical protein CCP4SC76_1300002 [Gammaproteobacteria bacterium]
MDRRNRSAIHRNHQRVAKRAEVLLGLIAELNPNDLDAKLASQRDKDPSFQNSPRLQSVMDSALFLEHVSSELALLEWMCGLPLPDRTDLTPTKTGAARAARTLMMKRLKREAKKYFVAPLHEVIATMTDVALDFDGETSSDDVRKA